MAFPGTFNISYYKGDTYEFVIYPKDSSGQPFDLTNYGATFTIASSRGTSPDVSIGGYALIPDDGGSIRCAILPEDAVDMTAGSSYVYDVQIDHVDNNADPATLVYPLTYTVLTGTITVTSDITGAA